ncbi:prephenate dehydratase [Bacillus sp. 165]|uniref:prephenate dehydratase n=1 Tax=Bacillus sp. 165 TaxID=1529117 RepID=UPI001AD970C7|nr:prephenate dehydratase [Bacillus sp. 165]MBO9130494.1 prephenate dehydratase [Bacillus sp. 165]
MRYKVGYLGPEATFTNIAVTRFFFNEDSVPYATIPECMDAAASNEIDFAVVPLENAIEGSVNITVDYLIHEQPLYIVGELIVPIRQHLLVHPCHQTEWSKVTHVYSHPHAIAQCHKFLHQQLKGALFENMTSTSAAAKYVSEHPDQKIAAIANEAAAEKYALCIARPDIHTYKKNHTRFVILHKAAVPLASREKFISDKTTLMVTLPSDYAGALHQVLSAFAWRKLNLSKIESRPMKTGLGNYFFLIDVDMAYDAVLLPGVKMELEALGCSVQVLGSYPCYLLN